VEIGHTGGIVAVAISPAPEYNMARVAANQIAMLATASADRTIRLWVLEEPFSQSAVAKASNFIARLRSVTITLTYVPT
jgi:hypothetical protein